MKTGLSGPWHSAGRSSCRVLQTASAAGPQRCIRHIHSVAARRPACETSGRDYAHPYLQRSVCRAAADPQNKHHPQEQGQQDTQQEEGRPQPQPQQQQRRRRRTKADTAAKEPRPLEKQQQEVDQAAVDTRQQQDEAQPQQAPRRRRQRRQSKAETAAKDPQAQHKQPQEEDQAAVGAAQQQQQQQQQQVEEQQQPEAVSPGVSSDAPPEAGPALSDGAPTGAPLPVTSTSGTDNLAATGQEQQDAPASSDSSAGSSGSSDAGSPYTWLYGYTTYEQVGYGTPTYGTATSAGTSYEPVSYGGTPAAPPGYVPAYGAPGSVPTAYSPISAVPPVYGPAASGPPAYGPPADQPPADGPPGPVPSVDWPTGYEAAGYGYPSYTYSQPEPVAMAPPLMAVDFNADNRNTVGLSGCLAADPNLAINNGDNYKVEMIVLPFAFKSDGDNHIQAPNPVKVHVWGTNGQAQAVWEQLRKSDPIAVLGTLRLDNQDNIRTKAGPAITVDAVVVARVKDSTIPRNAYCIPFSGVYPIGMRTFARMGPSAGWRDTPSACSSSPYNLSSESSSAAGSPAYNPGGESSSAANKPAYVPADQYRVDDVQVAYETASAWCSGATLQQLAAERRCGLCQVAESVLQGQELVAGSGQPFDWHRLVRELGVNEQLLTAIKEGLVACREQVDRQGRVLRKAVRLYLRAHPVAGAMVRDQEAAWRNMDLTYRQISAVREGVLAGGL